MTFFHFFIGTTKIMALGAKMENYISYKVEPGVKFYIAILYGKKV